MADYGYYPDSQLAASENETTLPADARRAAADEFFRLEDEVRELSRKRDDLAKAWEKKAAALEVARKRLLSYTQPEKANVAKDEDW